MRDRSARALVSILARTSGRAALRRGGPLYLGILVLGVVVFGGNDAPARELTGVARDQPVFRCLLLALWLILAAPVARTLLASPASRFVRVFPVSWASAGAWLVLGLVLVEGPWIVLWLPGGGPLGALAAGCAAAAGHALVVGRPRRSYEVVGAVAWLAGVAAGPAWWGLLGFPILVLALRRTWIAGYESAVSSDASTSIPRSSSLALATCYVAVIARRDRALLGRWALLALTGAGIATLAIRNNRLVASDSVIGVSLGVMSPLAVFGATGLGEAVLQAERHGRWLLDVSATSRAVRELGAVLAVAFYGSLAGFVHGAIVALSSVTRVRVTLSALGGSVVLGAVCAMVPRWTSRARDRAGRALVTRIVLGGVLSYLAAAFTEAGLLAGVGLTAGLCALVPPEPSGAALLAREEGE